MMNLTFILDNINSRAAIPIYGCLSPKPALSCYLLVLNMKKVFFLSTRSNLVKNGFPEVTYSRHGLERNSTQQTEGEQERVSVLLHQCHPLQVHSSRKVFFL
jgi:hypothetical protein